MSRGLHPSLAHASAWAALAASLLYWDASLERPPSAVMAVSTRDAGALCSRTAYPWRDFWERLKAVGVDIALLPEERLGDLAADGRVIGFSRAEWEKWSAAGVLAPGLRLRAGTVWIRERAVLLRVLAAARTAGVFVSTSAAGGFFFVEFPERFDWAGLSVGIAPDEARALAGLGLLVAPDDGGPVLAAGRRMERLSLPVGAPPAGIMAAIHESPGRVVVWSLAAGGDVDGVLGRLRDTARRLRRKGWVFGPRVPEAPPESSRPWPGLLAFGLATLLGPLLAARAALGAMKASGPFVRRRLALGSPVVEIAAGVLACWGAAACAGLAARVAAHFAAEASGPAWRAWAWAAPLALGVLSLYPLPWPGLRRVIEAPLTAGWMLRAAAWSAAIYLCLNAVSDPVAALLAWAGKSSFASSDDWWWLPWRWREILVGFPFLVRALSLVDRGWEETEPGNPGDPRQALLLGLLAPAGVIAIVSDLGSGLGAALARSLLVAALGCAVGVRSGH